MKNNIDGVRDNIIFCFWHGPEMSKNRKECYENILSTQENIFLLTEDNLSEFEITTRPIHKGFKYLSSTHKSDYIRSYIMNFYGGGYTDIKKQTSSWASCFDILNNTDFLGCGYREIHPSHIAINEKTAKNISDYKNFIGNGAYIFKKNTALTNEWYETTNKKMDSIFDDLKNNPANHPRTIRGGIQGSRSFYTGYPLGWVELLGDIYHPIVYTHRNQILKNLPKPLMTDYR